MAEDSRRPAGSRQAALVRREPAALELQREGGRQLPARRPACRKAEDSETYLRSCISMAIYGQPELLQEHMEKLDIHDAGRLEIMARVEATRQRLQEEVPLRSDKLVRILEGKEFGSKTEVVLSLTDTSHMPERPRNPEEANEAMLINTCKMVLFTGVTASVGAVGFGAGLAEFFSALWSFNPEAWVAMCGGAVAGTAVTFFANLLHRVGARKQRILQDAGKELTGKINELVEAEVSKLLQEWDEERFGTARQLALPFHGHEQDK